MHFFAIEIYLSINNKINSVVVKENLKLILGNPLFEMRSPLKLRQFSLREFYENFFLCVTRQKINFLMYKYVRT